MEYIISYLEHVPGYVWQIIALLLPGNKLFRFIAERLAASAQRLA
jgi:hypothetical protein